jgi:hypothetical protein
MDVTIAVGTFGSYQWRHLAERRAIPSGLALGVPVVHCHADTLHDARNGALAKVNTEWVIHLDADDELEPGYLEAMAAGTRDVRAPAVRYVHLGGGRWPAIPKVWGHTHECEGACLTQGNWLVIGSMVRADMVRDLGGWRDFPWSEDWDLWLRCHLAGALIEAVPDAVYRAYITPRSRNRSASHEVKLATHRAIEQANGLLPGGERA